MREGGANTFEKTGFWRRCQQRKWLDVLLTSRRRPALVSIATSFPGVADTFGCVFEVSRRCYKLLNRIV